MKKIALLVLLTALFAGSASGTEKVSLVIGEWPPFVSEAMEGRGAAAEIVTAVLQEMGMEPEYTFVPWKRAEQMVLDGEAWASFPYLRTAEREEKFLFSDNLLTGKEVFFSYKKEIAWEKLEDLKPYVVGTAGGYSVNASLAAAGLKTDEANNVESSFKKLQAGRVDLVPENEIVGWSIIKKLFPNEVGDFKVSPNPTQTGTNHLLVSKAYPNSEELLKKFNEALAKIKASGTYGKILQKYGVTE